jgi:hypothetical protein
MLWYKHTLHTIFSDTMFAGSMSHQGIKMAQAYATSFGWARAHPMRCKGEANETPLSLYHNKTTKWPKIMPLTLVGHVLIL